MKTVAPHFRQAHPIRWLALTAFAALAVSLSHTAYSADTRYYPIIPTPGGLSPGADITSSVLTNGQLKIDWNGYGGPYVLERRLKVDSGAWEDTGAPTNANSFSVPLGDPGSVFRVRSPLPQYKGSDTCAVCHEDTHTSWSQTIHAGAFNTLKAIGQEKNSSCLPCHTVGYGVSTGFKDFATTPQFANVQCENCHGPAAQHAKAPNNLALRPKVTYSAELCGGCHNDFHHPTYEEWQTAGHAVVTPDVASGLLSTNVTTSTGRMNSCGACHSGAVRMQMLRTVGGDALKLPSGKEAADTGITCAVCHDSHKANVDGTHSLRNPRYSTNFFSYDTSTNTTFAKQYNENVQTCGQCHNLRGAKPTDTSRPPHHSPQYNMLIGDVGVALGYVPASLQAPHSKIQEQCTHCHTHQHSPTTPTEETPVYTGHDFKPSTKSCLDCHESESEAEEKIAETQTDIKARIQEVKGLLDQWGETKAPEALRAKYGKLAWEYTTVGQISNPSAKPGVTGPTTAEQADVSLEIKKARMYLYVVEHDGSYGVHNGKYARYLLGTAKTNVVNLLNAP